MCAACAQTAQSAEDAFRDSIMNKGFVLRNFSAETEVHATWTGSDLNAVLPRWHTFGPLRVESVELNGQKLDVKCVRQVILEDKTGRLVPFGEKEPVEISIDLNGGNPAVVLPEIQRKLFFADISQALSAIPKELQQVVPASLKKMPGGKTPECDCAAWQTDACIGRAPTEGLQPPSVIHTEDPKYSAEAVNLRISGTVRIALLLDDSGRIRDVWVTKPLGYGLDEQAAMAVRHYVFAPAKCHNAPRPMTIYIDVNFQRM